MRRTGLSRKLRRKEKKIKKTGVNQRIQKQKEIIKIRNSLELDIRIKTGKRH